MIGEDAKWKKITCKEARELTGDDLIFWRPGMTRCSDDPDNDPALVVEELRLR